MYEGRPTGVVDAADEAEARDKAESGQWRQIKDDLDYRIEEIEEETLRRGVMLRPELQERLLGASTEELTRVANELNEALTPMGVAAVAGMLLCHIARRAPSEAEGFDLVDKIVSSARALYHHRQEEDARK